MNLRPKTEPNRTAKHNKSGFPRYDFVVMDLLSSSRIIPSSFVLFLFILDSCPSFFSVNNTPFSRLVLVKVGLCGILIYFLLHSCLSDLA